ncbi:hypothetical protein DJ474_14260 [Bacillus sp. 8A6]|nr:hypothetical protein [Bacillus sp. 8A6]
MILPYEKYRSKGNCVKYSKIILKSNFNIDGN